MSLPPTNLDDNAKFLIAGAVNLYIESRRRMDGRVLISVEDVDPILGIAETLIAKRPLAKLPEVRSREPSEEEQVAIQTATEMVTEKVERRA